jgi:hypothetical protein
LASSLLSAPLMKDLMRITLLASIGRDRRSGVVMRVDPGAPASASARASTKDDKIMTTTTTTTTNSNGNVAEVSLDERKLINAIQSASQQAGRYTGISWSDGALSSSAFGATSSSSGATAARVVIGGNELGRLEREAQRQAAAASSAVAEAKALIALGDGKTDPADIRYHPLAHALHVWRALCIDGGDELRRVLVRSIIFSSSLSISNHHHHLNCLSPAP